MRMLTSYFPRLLVVFALVSAMASFGFAHRFAAQPVDRALVGYLAAGGALEDICGLSDGKSHQGTQSCEACRLVNAVILPCYDPAFAVSHSLPSTVQARLGAEILRFAKLDVTRAARGPPVI